jgi:hypothetical protein
MKIFMFYCLLFIHVNMCIYIMYIFIESLYCYYYVDIESEFRVSAGLVLRRSYHPNRCSVRFRISGSAAHRASMGVT